MTQLTLDTVDPIRNELEEKYRRWLHGHQAVFALFEKFALDMLGKRRRFGIAMLTERVRWEVASTIEPDADGYRINNNHRSYLARDLIRKHPALAELIETRCIKSSEGEPWPN